jgi:hypothetical protein
MGNALVWSPVRMNKTGALLFMSAPMPGDPAGQKLFEMFKVHKEAIKADGFSISKESMGPRAGSWNVMYWHNVTPTTHTPSEKGVPHWRVEFEDRIDRWTPIYQEIEPAPKAAYGAGRGAYSGGGRGGGNGRGRGQVMTSSELHDGVLQKAPAKPAAPGVAKLGVAKPVARAPASKPIAKGPAPGAVRLSPADLARLAMNGE